MKFNLQWIFIIVIFVLILYYGIKEGLSHYKLKKQSEDNVQNEHGIFVVKNNLAQKEKLEIKFNENTNITQFNTELASNNYTNKIISKNIKKYFWYGYWFNIDQFLIMRVDNTFEWSMSNYFGKGQFSYFLINEYKVKIKFLFHNSQEREWVLERINDTTIEIESSHLYTEGKLKFTLYKDNNYI